MKLSRLDKKKGAGTASLRSKFAYLMLVSEIEYFPETDEKGVRLIGDIVLKENCSMIPVYLTTPSQEYSYETQGSDDSKTFRVKFQGTHPGTELQALEFAKNFLENPFLIYIPGCGKDAPGKVLGQLCNPLIFVSSHRAARDGDRFTFTFEQRVGSEYLYYSYGGVVTAPPEPETPGGGGGNNPGTDPFDPTKWARINAENINGNNVLLWRDALSLYSKKEIDEKLAALMRDSFHTGPISTTANSVQLALSSSGTNSATIAGATLSKTTADSFPYTPVSPGKLKALVLYAKATSQIFYLAEGVQGDEAVSPDFEGLFIASITVSDGAQIVNPAGPQDYLYQSNDSWITQQIAGTESLLVAGNNPGSTFDISVKNGTANPGIAGITAEAKLFWEGRIFWLRNNSAVDIALTDTPVTGELTRFSIVQFEKPAVLKKAGWAAVKVKNSALVVIGLGGGAELPEGNTSDVLVKGAEEWEASNRLTLAEQEIDAEIVNRAAADVTLQQNINAEATARQNADAGKVDKPTADGTWMLQKVGAAFTWVTAVMQNIANTDLSNISARIFTQGNVFTWDTAGFKYYLRGLVDKTGQAAYSKVVVVHPTTGEKVTRDFDDAQATTSAIQKATTSQKTAMRTALLGSATPASPVINHILPLFLTRGEDQFLIITGINLTLLDPTNIYFIDSNSVRHDALSYYNITGSEVQTFWRLPNSTAKGKYSMKILNGAAVQGNSAGVVEVVDAGDVTGSVLSPFTSKVVVKDNLSIERLFVFNNNSLTLPKNPNLSLPPRPDVLGTIAVKSENIFKGNINSSWEITFTIKLMSGGNDSESRPCFGLTETTHIEMLQPQDIVTNVYVEKTTSPSIAIGGQVISIINLRKIIIRKTGDEVMLLAFSDLASNTPIAIEKKVINVLKNYALFFIEYDNNQQSNTTGKQYEILSIKIKD